MTTVRQFELPEMSEDFAWWLGVLYADGHIEINRHGTPQRIVLSCTEDEPEITYKYMGISKKLFDYYPKYKKQSGTDKGFSLRIYSTSLLDKLAKRNILKQKCYDLVFPQEIKESKKEIQLAFIAGVFDGDGFLSLKTNRLGSTLSTIGLVMVCKDFMNDIYKILNRHIECYWGIVSREYMREQGKNAQDAYKIRIPTKKWSDFSNLLTESAKVNIFKKNLMNKNVRLSYESSII